MSSSASRTLQIATHRGTDLAHSLGSQIAALREELADLSDAVLDYGGHAFSDVQHNAAVLAKQVRRQGKVVAREVGRQADQAGRLVRDNPVPVIVALGTVVLLSTLLLTQRD